MDSRKSIKVAQVIVKNGTVSEVVLGLKFSYSDSSCQVDGCNVAISLSSGTTMVKGCAAG